MQSLKEIIQKLKGDPYEILESQPMADFSIVKKNYRTLALKYHPDRNKEESAKEMFIKINQAYQFLEDQSNRQNYANHIKAIEEQKKRFTAMSEERKEFAQTLKRKEQQILQRKKDLDEEIKRRKQFFARKMQEEQQREQLRQKINSQMKPEQFYEDVSSIVVSWQEGLCFTPLLLEQAFSPYGNILKMKLQSKRRTALLTFDSIEKVTSMVLQFKHPLISVRHYLDRQRRSNLLRVLERKKQSQIDLSLNSENIERLKMLVNRKSNLYVDSSMFRAN